MKRIQNLLFFILLILLPLFGGENYLFNLSPIWGKGILILFVSLVLFFQIFLSGRHDQVLLSPGIDGLILAYLIYIIASSFDSKSRVESFITLLGFVGSLSFGILIRLYVKDIEGIQKVLKMIIFSTLPVIAYALYQSVWEFREIAGTVAGDATLRPFARHFELHRTSFSTFLTSNSLACYLLMTIPLTFYFILIEKGERKYFWTALFSLISFALFLTGSKGAVLVYFALNFLMLLFLGRIERSRLFAFARILVQTIGLSFLMVLLVWRFEWKPAEQNTISNEISTFTLTGDKLLSSADGRIHYWKTSLNIWKDQPIIGSGIGTFATISSRYQESAFYAKHVHNDYLEMLAETGVIGLALFLGINLLLWFRGIKCYQEIDKSPDFKLLEMEKPGVLLLVVSLFFSMSAFLLHSMIDFNWAIMANRTLFLILFMSLASLLGMMPKELSEKIASRFIPVRVNSRISVISLLILLVMMGISVPNVTLAESYYDLAVDPFEKNLSRSIEFGESAVENLPWHFKYHLFLAEVYRRHGIQTNTPDDLDKAMNEARRALLLQPEISQTHAEMGLLYMTIGEFDQSEQEWEKALERERGKIGLYNNLGRLYIRQHELKKAEAVLEKGLSYEQDYKVAEHPDMIDVIEGHLLLAGLTEISGEKRNSLKEYKKALALLKAYPDLDSMGHWNIIEPEYKLAVRKYTEMKVEELSSKF